MSELKILAILMWVLASGFLVKSLTFGTLRLSLRGSADEDKTPEETELSNRLKTHYTALTVQGVALVPLFVYYGTAIQGNGGWLPAPWRIALYAIDVIMVIWAAYAGIRMMVAFVAWELTRQEVVRNEPAGGQLSGDR